MKIRTAVIFSVVFFALMIALFSLRGRLSPESDDPAMEQTRLSASGPGPGQGASPAPTPPPLKSTSARKPLKMPKIIRSQNSTPLENKRIELVHRYIGEADPEKRFFMVPELVDLNDPQAVFQVLELLKTETDPTVRGNLIFVLGHMPYSINFADEIIAEVAQMHKAPRDPSERLRIQQMVVELKTPKAAEFLREVYADADTLPMERIDVAESLVRLHNEVPLVPRQEAESVVLQMRLDAQAISDPVDRAQAYRALHVTRFDSREFYQERLAMETDPDVRRVLSVFAEEELRPTPTPGPVPTPWPGATP